MRDHIQHSSDFRRNPVTCAASEVLAEGAGYCYAKSHLLAGLLPANGIPAGFCYQRLSIDEKGAPYSLHGFNAVHLPKFGWYRVDPRGNKPGLDAQFSPPVENLAFPILYSEERLFPEILGRFAAGGCRCAALPRHLGRNAAPSARLGAGFPSRRPSRALECCRRPKGHDEFGTE